MKKKIAESARDYLFQSGEIPKVFRGLVSEHTGLLMLSDACEIVFSYLKREQVREIRVGDYVYNRYYGGVYKVTSKSKYASVDMFYLAHVRKSGEEGMSWRLPCTTVNESHALIPKGLPSEVYQVIFQDKDITRHPNSAVGLTGAASEVRIHCPDLFDAYMEISDYDKHFLALILAEGIRSTLLRSLVSGKIKCGTWLTLSPDVHVGGNVFSTHDTKYVYTVTLAEKYREKLGYRRMVTASAFVDAILGVDPQRIVTSNFMFDDVLVKVGDLITMQGNTWSVSATSTVYVWSKTLASLADIISNTRPGVLDVANDAKKPTINSSDVEAIPNTFKAKRDYMRGRR